MTFVTTGVELEGITQSETRLTEIPKDMWNQRKREKKTKQNKKKCTHRCKKEKHKQYLIGGHQR